MAGYIRVKPLQAGCRHLSCPLSILLLRVAPLCFAAHAGHQLHPWRAACGMDQHLGSSGGTPGISPPAAGLQPGGGGGGMGAQMTLIASPCHPSIPSGTGKSCILILHGGSFGRGLALQLLAAAACKISQAVAYLQSLVR